MEWLCRCMEDVLGRPALLLIVVLAVEQAVSAVARPAEGAQAHSTLHTGLMPRLFIYTQEESVCNGRLTACTHLTSPHML